jgi:predicted  nucleic acid-binding Zn-ribbon protein
MSATTLGECVGADLGLSEDDREYADHLADSLAQVPTATRSELWDRYFDKWPLAADRAQERSQRGPSPLESSLGMESSEIVLPGFGRKYGSRDGEIPCGAHIPHTCEGCGHTVDVGRTCNRSTCPRCMTNWAIKRAKPIVSRLQSAAKMKSAASDGTAVYKHHGVFSPDPEQVVDEEDAVEAVKDCMDAVADYLRTIDAEGIVIYHPFRGAGEHGDDIGEWKKRVASGRNWEGDVADEVVFSPHFHVICVTPHFPGGDLTRYVHERTGWIVKRITGQHKGDSRISLSDMESVARAVTYCLSHCGIDTTGDNNRYLHKKIGSAYHNADDRHHDEAAEAIRAVAPRTLGVRSANVECKNDVPAEERENEFDEPTPDDADGDAADPSTEDDGMATCRGELVSVDKADFISRESWQQQAIHAADAVEAKRAWEQAGGWQGWSGQTTLTGEPPD